MFIESLVFLLIDTTDHDVISKFRVGDKVEIKESEDDDWINASVIQIDNQNKKCWKDRFIVVKDSNGNNACINPCNFEQLRPLC